MKKVTRNIIIAVVAVATFAALTIILLSKQGIISIKESKAKYSKELIKEKTGANEVSDSNDNWSCFKQPYKSYRITDASNRDNDLIFFVFENEAIADRGFQDLEDRFFLTNDSDFVKTENTMNGPEWGVCDAEIVWFAYKTQNMIVMYRDAVNGFMEIDPEYIRTDEELAKEREEQAKEEAAIEARHSEIINNW